MEGELPEAKICYFWYKTRKCQVFRLILNPIFFPKLEQVCRHLGNQCGLSSIPTIYKANSSGTFEQIEDFSRLRNGNQYVLVPAGITPKNAAPEFMKMPNGVAIVKHLFVQWDDLNDEIVKKLKSPGVHQLFDKDGYFSSEFDIIAEAFGIVKKEE